MVAEGPLGETGALGDLAAEVDREATPEGPCVRVPEDGRFVVVGVGSEWRPQGRVVVVVVGAAAAGSAARGAVVDGAEAGCGEGGEDA